MCWCEMGDCIAFKTFCFQDIEGNIREAVEKEEKLFGEVKAVKVFAYLDDGESTSGRYWAAVNARTRCVWVKSWNEVLKEISSMAEMGCLHEIFKASNSVLKRSMVPE